MDESSSAQISKRDKSLGKDRISSLPDNVLHYILSILPTKHAVSTSVLSTKWKYLWTSVSNLQLCDHMLCSSSQRSNNAMIKRRFMNFVDRVLFLHDVSNIQKFDLSCREEYDASRVNAWITTVIRRKVQELILSLSSKQPIVFPRCIFDCDSLTKLNINIDCHITAPTLVCFPHLKVLYLEYVTFCSGHSTQQVRFSFPVLDEFSADEVIWMNMKKVEISAPSLDRLIIFDHRYDHIQSCEIHIFAENLVFLDLSSHLGVEYILHKSSTLADAIIRTSNTTNDIAHRLIKLLRRLRIVERLCLSNVTIDALYHSDTIVDFSTFSSLIYLRVAIEEYDFSAADVMHLLHKTPNIKSLVFDGVCVIYEENWAPEIIPQCIQSNLKFVGLEYFGGSESELWAAKFFLKNAMVLEEMAILSSEKLSKDPKEHVEVTKQLLKLPRASAFCVINLR